MIRFTKFLLAFVALCSLLSLPARAELDVAKLKTTIEASVENEYPKLDALYKDIHAHPEIAFQEVKTAAKLAAEMRAIGFEVTEQVGRTGLVAMYRNGAGPTVMVRTELDALPMEEKTGLPYASRDKTTWQGRETFVAHSCGHDIHMASWLGTAKTLVSLKDQWHGTLMFIAQPAEEIGAGAMAMLWDGLFTRFPKPDFAFGLHDGPFPYGHINYRVGVGSSNSDSLAIKFHGRGGHGAAPQQTIDPVLIAARFIVDVQTVISREKDPIEFGVVSIGAIHSRRGRGARHHSQLQAGGTSQDGGGDRADREGRCSHVGRAPAGYFHHRGRQSRDERSRAGSDCREGAEGRIWRQVQDLAARHRKRGFLGIRRLRSAVDVFPHRRLRAGARRRGPQRDGPAIAPQPFAAVRAGAETDHPNRRRSDDARRAQRLRSARAGAVAVSFVIPGRANGSALLRRPMTRLRASPESITTIGSMDSEPAANLMKGSPKITPSPARHGIREIRT